MRLVSQVLDHYNTTFIDTSDTDTVLILQVPYDSNTILSSHRSHSTYRQSQLENSNTSEDKGHVQSNNCGTVPLILEGASSVWYRILLICIAITPYCLYLVSLWFNKGPADNKSPVRTMLPLTIVKFLYTQSHISDNLMFTVVSVSSLEVYTNKWNRRTIRKFLSDAPNLVELSFYTMYMLHA